MDFSIDQLERLYPGSTSAISRLNVRILHADPNGSPMREAAEYDAESIFDIVQ